MESAHGELAAIPWFVQDINGKNAELGNGTVDGSTSKATLVLQPFDVITQFLSGNLFGLFMKDVVQVIQIGSDIGAAALHGMVRKTAEEIISL